MALFVLMSVIILSLFGFCMYLMFKHKDQEMRFDAIWMAAHDERMSDELKIKYIIGVLLAKKFPFIPEDL